MQLWIILFYIVLITKVSKQGEKAGSDGGGSSGGGSSGGGGGGGKKLAKEDRRSYPLADPGTAMVGSPINARSAGVLTYDEKDEFQTLYPMRCGGSVYVDDKKEISARCAPDLNEIVIIQKDDEIKPEFCSRVIVCEPNKDAKSFELCDTNKISVYIEPGKTCGMKFHSTEKRTPHTTAYIPVKKGNLVYHQEIGCRLLFKKEHKLMHRFQNRAEHIKKYMEKWPGFYLQPPFYQPRRLFQHNVLTFGGLLHRGVKTLSSKECKAGCDIGRLFHYAMDKNVMFYSKIFVDGATCEWMKICLHGETGIQLKSFECNDHSVIHVYIRNGFVVMPGALNGVPIRLVKSESVGESTIKKMKKFRPTQIGFDFDGERFTIWSVGRERVASTTKIYHDGHIILYFSHHNCLVKGKGIRYLGKENGVVYQIAEKEDISSVNVVDGQDFKYAAAEIRETLATLPTEKPTPNVSAVAKATTTPMRAAMVIAADAKLIAKARRGWVIIMMFAGLFVGSMVSLLLAGSLMYFARRNVYAVWYRGMYKRYGCDASGVTGGVTGSAFGNTTTGAMSTLAGTTTGGTTLGATTGGTSGMSTSGTTGDFTTGGTSTGGTSTGGTSMGDTSGISTGGTTGGTTGGADVSGTSTGGDMVAM